ncbi:CubicO group peptidase, beta-lactamase class C family [Nonomuraea solani]|uniref:CubicO group peptidase, beta-lactamase class C family n=1 Tax=Nonomuraea solani TaxID=1144553 RepID=A0A1H6E305_9ACTN|nr:serine hydrolase domain-containing protein [Nonomuraea solani]SEG92078.1 CubicO group peptidase, beta-lactamase class C family [Nonomuraea solani]
MGGTVDGLTARHAGVVVAAVAGASTEIQGSGSYGAGTLFEIGSVTKVFTALTLARLVVAGTAGLDEPLAALLPEGTRVPSRDGAEIKLRHLAGHTSGLPRLPKGMLLEALLRPSKPDPYAHCTAGFLLDGLSRTRLGATPGRRFRYSNLGAGLLGLALAHRSGTDYETLVTREICAPLGMADTGIADRQGRLVQGHDRRKRPVAPWHLADLAGAGGLRSTAADLVTFVRAQLAPEPGGLADAIRLSHEVEHRASPFSWVHLGWMGLRSHPKQGGGLLIWHNGRIGGFSSFVGFNPEKEVAVIILSDTHRSVDTPGLDLIRRLESLR